MAFVDRLDFLSSENQCGQTLLRIVSRGSSIIAELLRLSTNIPEVFYGPDKVKDPEQRKYLDVLIDFTYLRNPDEFEKKLNDQQELSDLDHEFQDNHKDILDRFYKIFDSIFKYQLDINKYINDINNGYYLQHSLDNILQDIGGRQLLSEVLYLWGIILITLEEKIPGYIRERMLIALYRLNGEVGLENFDSVCKLCRNSGFIPGPEGKRPKNHPDAFMARFPMNPELIRLVIGRLQTDDIYLMANSYPSPDHRSTRLANQAAMLYIILYFAPDLLNNNKATMREIVDKYFNDNWVIATYMGQVVDLTVEWAPYPAAKTAIDNIITTTLVKSLHDKNIELMSKSLKELQDYLKEGLLTQEYMLDNIDNLMNCVRHCNIALRWRILHRKTSLRQNETFRKIIESTVSPQAIVTLLLNASQLEYILKNMLQELLNQKDIAWTDGKTAAADRMVELSEYFTGEKALTRVKRDENLMKWFSSLAEEVKSLNLVDSHATATGRKIKTIMKALEDVEQFEAVDTNIQIKTFLNDAREIFRTMIRTVNIRNEILNSLDVISDLSYAWQILTDYITIFQERITKDPKSVVLLRAVFLKAASMLDVPLVRIMAIDSPDAVSVAAYYSQELVEFVRTVLGIIPVSVFHILGQIVSLQTNKMQPIPIRLEAKDLKDYAQLDARFELAKLTHEVSIFTEGILVMEKTLLGVIQVDPRQILEEGLRRELVRKLSYALHNDLTFKDFTNRKEIYDSMNNVANKLDGFKKSIEYLQDYISIAGLKIFQQEFSRTINYNTEQEANRFIKKKIFDSLSRYQNKKIPIPRLIHQTSGTIDTEDTSALTFMGRIMSSMLALTDPTHTVYAPECSAWFEHPAPDQKAGPTIETCGIRTFALLERSIGVIGLRGLDRLLAFRTVNIFNQFLRYYSQQVHPFRTLLDQVRMSLFPEYKVPAGASKVYTTAVKKVENLMLPLLKFIRKIGQGQLIRRQIANLLQFGCQLDAHLLYQALDTFNRGLVNDIRIHYSNPEKPYPDSNNPLLFETTVLLEASGLDDPLQKIYVTSQPLEGLPVLLFLFLLAYLPKLEYDPNFGALIRKKSKMPLDGIPLAIGIACLLKQFHPSYTKQLLAYLGQFIRSNLQEIFHDVDNRPQDIPRDLLNTIIFMEQLCNFSSIPRAMVHAFVPPYIFDALKYSAVPIKK